MPIKLTPININPLIHGYTWEITNEQMLAEQIARVALGQARHVEKILNATAGATPVLIDGALSAAAAMLTVAPGADPWHRDGWMFQIMSWVAAHKAGKMSLINTPQMILAQKGFDGLEIQFNSDGSINAAIIFEDKATDKPRETIRKLVWPEFVEYESGREANLLVSEVTSLLEKRHGIDVDDVIRKVIWKDARSFRVSITAGKSHQTDKGRNRLFKDYDKTIPGNVSRRRGETLYVKDLRSWMDGIANKALAYITTLKV